MSTVAATATAELKAILERIDRLEDERQEIKDDITAVYADAKARGFDAKAIRGMVKRKRAKDPQKVAQDEALLDTYLHACGLVSGNPVADAMGALASDVVSREQVVDALKKMVPVFGEIIVKIGGQPLRVWRDEAGVAYAEPWVEPEAPAPAAKTGRGLKPSATVLSIVPTDPAATASSSAVKAAADRAERGARKKPPADEPASSDEEEPVE